MSLWNKSNKLPQYLGKDKRNVVVTGVGYVRRKAYTDADGDSRVKTEILVPITGLANSTNWGSPKITDMWHSVSSGANTITVNTWISFSEPLSFTNSGRIKLVVANTISGNNINASCVPTTAANIRDGNKMVFRWKPTRMGTYKVQAQTAANGSATAANVRSINTGTELVSWVVGGEASNNAGVVVIS